MHWQRKLLAVEGLSESMSYELEPFGIKVVIVEPGVIRTNFVTVVAKKSHPNSPYSQVIQKTAAVIENMMKNSSSPDLVAKVVLNAVTCMTYNILVILMEGGYLKVLQTFSYVFF
jgi:short-subunit dehydrogenase